jgi:hypothetical protein
LGDGPFPGEEYTTDVTGLSGVIQGREELVDGVRPEGVAHLGSVEGDADHTGVLGAVIGDVGEVETGYDVPVGRVEYLRNHESRG